MIPILYPQNETIFNNLGYGYLTDVLRCEVTEERNGAYDLTMEYPVGGALYEHIINLNIILAKPNNVNRPHAFRIFEVEKSTESIDGIIYVQATSITMDLKNNMLIDSVSVDTLSVNAALSILKSNLMEPTYFEFYSDIDIPVNHSWERKNPLGCIAGENGSLLQEVGGELLKTNTKISLLARRGRNNVTTIRKGKNLEGIKIRINTDNLITSIIPYVKIHEEPTSSEIDTSISSGSAETNEVTIVGNRVDSKFKNKYPISYIRTVDLSEKGDIKDLEALNREAARYFYKINPGCDKPDISVSVELIDLYGSAATDDFFNALERLDVCDTVDLYVPELDYIEEVMIKRLTYDVLAEKVISFDAGSRKKDIISEAQESYEAVNNKINGVEKYIQNSTNGIKNTVINMVTNSSNKIFRGYDTPDTSVAREGDIWYQPTGNDTDIVVMWRFNGLSWVQQFTDTSGISGNFNAANITGTLNANDVNIINMNANNITSGELVISDRMVLTDGNRNILYIDNNGSAIIDIDNLKIKTKPAVTEDQLLDVIGDNGKRETIRIDDDGLKIKSSDSNMISIKEGRLTADNITVINELNIEPFTWGPHPTVPNVLVLRFSK